MRTAIDKILKEYQSAKKEKFEKHSLAKFLRYDAPDEVADIIKNSRYITVGSAGQSQWAKCPWIGVFDRFITETAQSGYYIVYLFREDMGGVYLSLNQGVTQIRSKYKGDAKEALKKRINFQNWIL